MRHCMMYYAGYKHLSCDRATHEHRLQNLHTKQVEIWVPNHYQVGIPYKNTFLEFKECE